MYARPLNTATLIILVQHMITGALNELLTVCIAEQIVVRVLMLAIFQKLLQHICHCLIDGHDERFSILCNIDIDHIVIEIHILDLDIHKTALPNTRTEEESRNHPRLILRKIALLDVRLLQQCS